MSAVSKSPKKRLVDIWLYSDVTLNSILTRSGRDISSMKSEDANYKKAIVAMIFYNNNTLEEYDRRIVADPNFPEAMKTTTSLKKGLDKLFSIEVSNTFNDFNLTTLLSPYYKTIRDFVYRDGKDIKLQTPSSNIILVRDALERLNFKALRWKDTIRLYLSYTEGSHNFFEVLSFNISEVGDIGNVGGAKSLLKIETHDRSRINANDKYIYLCSSTLEIYSVNTLELLKSYNFGYKGDIRWVIVDEVDQTAAAAAAVILTNDNVCILDDLQGARYIEDLKVTINDGFINEGKLYLRSPRSVLVYELNDGDYIKTLPFEYNNKMAVFGDLLFTTNFHTFLDISVNSVDKVIKRIKLDGLYYIGSIKIFEDLLYLVLSSPDGGSVSINVYSTDTFELLDQQTVICKKATDMGSFCFL
jgi:hypothetical protein